MQLHRDITINGKKVKCHIQAESYGDFLSFIERDFAKANSMQVKSYKKAWAGTDNLAEALSVAHHGWEEGLRKASEIMSRIEPKIFQYMKHRIPAYSFAGGLPDIGNYLASNPEYFMTFDAVEKKNQGALARVVCNVVASSGFSKEQLVTRGVAVLAVVDAMEKQGRSCEVVAVETVNSYAGGGVFEIEVPLKRAGECLEMERIAFALAHPSFLRRLCFAAQDLAGMNDRPSYGIPLETTLDKGDLYFGSMSYDQAPHNDEALIQWIIRMIESQDVELEES